MGESDEDYGDDDYSQVMQQTEFSFQNRMQNNYQHTMSKSELRRSTKPIMEKRRRARINRCLNELKSLILDAMKKDPARHSKLEKADILEMTVKHLQDVQKRQLSSAMIADPAVMRKFRGGFEECATEVGRYIEGLEGIDMGVRRRLAAHLSSCVTTLPAARNDVNDTNNNNSSSRVNAISASLRLIPSRLPNGELALLVPDAQSLPNNVLPFFQLADHTNMVPNMGQQGFCEMNQVSTTTTDKLPDSLRLDASPSHPSAFTAVNKHVITERTPSPTSSVVSSVSSSGDRNVPTQHAVTVSMSSEVSSTSEQLAETSTTDHSSSLNSSTSSSLSPQNIARNPQTSSGCSPCPKNKLMNSNNVSPPYLQAKQYIQGRPQFSPNAPAPKQQQMGGKNIDCGYNLPQNASQFSPNAPAPKQQQTGGKNIDCGYNLQQNASQFSPNNTQQHQKMSDKNIDHQQDVGYSLSQKHHAVAPKFSYPDSLPKTVVVDVSDRFGPSAKQSGTTVKFPQADYTYMDALKSYEPFPLVNGKEPFPLVNGKEPFTLVNSKERLSTPGKRPIDCGLKPSQTSEYSLPLTVETNLDGFQGKSSVESARDTCLPTPIDFSKNVGAINHVFQTDFVPSLKRRRLEAARNAESAAAEICDVTNNEVQLFSPLIIQHEKSGTDVVQHEKSGTDVVPDTAGRSGGSEGGTSENMWRPW